MTDAIKILGSVAEVVKQHLPHVLANRREVTWKDDGSPVTSRLPMSFWKMPLRII